MRVKDHYDSHLAHFYAWMAGDVHEKATVFQALLAEHDIQPRQNGLALDLGAGHGIQSLGLLRQGFQVTAVDFSAYLLAALKSQAEAGSVHTVLEDIRAVRQWEDQAPELIICCGDTLTHLPDAQAISQFIRDIYATLSIGGRMVLSYRDYSLALEDTHRFIPVKSDDTRILTCILEYGPEKVQVTDLLHTRSDDGWTQKASSYEKVRISPAQVAQWVQEAGMQLRFHAPIRRMYTLIAEKQS